MKTQDLIGLLAQDTQPAATTPYRQLALTLVGATAVCGLLLQLFLGLNPALREMAAQPVFLTKMLWLATLAGFSAYGLLRLARPGIGPGQSWRGMGLALLAMLALGGAQSLLTGSPAQAALWLGSSWQACLLSIVALSLPVLAALLWTLRQMAPTRLALAGATAGALAGALAASVYSLHCTETSFSFFAAWYVAGLLAACGLGALLGPRLLRW